MAGSSPYAAVHFEQLLQRKLLRAQLSLRPGRNALAPVGSGKVVRNRLALVLEAEPE